MNCAWCDEPVGAIGQHPAFRGEPMHLECGFRSIVGSVAHIERRCSCYVHGPLMDMDGDPPGMTRREAAKAALATFERMLAGHARN